MIRSPIVRSAWRPPHVPTRMIFLTPSWTSSSITIAADGQPMPLDCTETGLPSKVPREAEHSALAVASARRRRGRSRRCTSPAAGRRGEGRLRRSRRGWLERELACAEAYRSTAVGPEIECARAFPCDRADDRADPRASAQLLRSSASSSRTSRDVGRDGLPRSGARTVSSPRSAISAATRAVGSRVRARSRASRRSRERGC